jgi:ABC-type Co2+ transport system permease subunit
MFRTTLYTIAVTAIFLAVVFASCGHARLGANTCLTGFIVLSAAIVMTGRSKKRI